MKDKTFSEFIEPLPMKEGNGIDLTAKLKSCNNTASLEPVSNNLANLNVNPSCLTETSTSSISSSLSTTSSQSQTETSHASTQQVSAVDIHVDVQKENTDQAEEGNSSDLSEDELKAVDEFIRRQNWSNSDAKKWNTALKFLMARRFDVERAIKLYEDHENLRKKESLYSINLCDEAFMRELEFGKFTILPFLKNYPVCALFTVKLHSAQQNTTPNAHTSDSTTLKVLIYQLDAALENPDAQRNGINFIYDMNNCKSSHFDMALSQKILTLVRGSYPARLNKLFVVSAPFWFKCFVKVLSILMREKLRERVLFVSNEELKNQIPVEILPDYLGGTYKLDHKSWLTQCNKLVQNNVSTCSYYYYEDDTKAAEAANGFKITKDLDYEAYDNNDMGVNQRKRPLTHQNEVESKKQIIEKDNLPEPLPFEEFYESIQINDSSFTNWMATDQLIAHIASIGAYGLSEEFKNIRSQPLYSTFNHFKSKDNAYKNRYRDVVCLDDSRVKLRIDAVKEFETHSNNKSGDESSENQFDYIHANFVDGWKQKNAFINAQGPLDETIEDFWMMIWQEMTLVIAMTTKVIEQRRLKCAQYWPLEVGQVMKLENLFEIENTNVEDLNDYKVTSLTIKHLPSGEKRNISHCQFLSWPDHGVPQTASHILDFIDIVRKNQRKYLHELNAADSRKLWNGHPQGPPICVHCSAGIGRTGTFCAIDISINRLNDLKVLNIEETINRIRRQRAQSVQTRDQYVFCYMALWEYAQQNRLLPTESLVDLEAVFSDLY